MWLGRSPYFGAAALILLGLGSCSYNRVNPYEQSTAEDRAHFKKVILPLPSGTHFVISQGAFGAFTHHDEGHEYTWDFDVPYGTPVIAVEDATVTGVWEPNDGGGGCDPRYGNTPHTLQLRHKDGTVAQYVHIQSRVRVGQAVKKGEVIAVTAQNGFICTPQLDFGIYLDERHLFGSGQMRTIPLLFEGLPDGGTAHEKYKGTVGPST